LTHGDARFVKLTGFFLFNFPLLLLVLGEFHRLINLFSSK
jgi:hypothetical protein